MVWLFVVCMWIKEAKRVGKKFIAPKMAAKQNRGAKMAQSMRCLHMIVTLRHAPNNSSIWNQPNQARTLAFMLSPPATLLHRIRRLIASQPKELSPRDRAPFHQAKSSLQTKAAL